MLYPKRKCRQFKMDYVPYLITEAFCCIFALTMVIRLKSGPGFEDEIRILRIMLIIYIVVVSTDLIYSLAEADIFIPEHYANATINAISNTGVALGCYAWYRFVAGRLKSFYVTNKYLQRLLDIPLYVICALNLLSIYTGWTFYINQAGHYKEGPLFGPSISTKRAIIKKVRFSGFRAPSLISICCFPC